MKQPIVVICAVLLLLCSQQPLSARLGSQQVAPSVLRVGLLADPELTESSGLVASSAFPGVFWTHNDHGSAPVLFAVSRQGRTLGKFKVSGATISDWEDISIDSSGNLYIADIGNNAQTRDEVQIYRVVEPNPRGAGSVRVVRTWRLKFPNNPKDCETFFVHGGFGYLVSKERTDGAVDLYRFSLASTARTVVLQIAGKIRVTSNVSGGAVSRDGQVLALVTENGAYAFRINGNPLTAARVRGYFTPFNLPQMEGAAFAGTGLLVTSEDGQVLLFNATPFRAQ
jgi:hypothetical protein